MPAGTSDLIEIESSPAKLLGLVAIGLGFVALSAAMALGWVHGKYPDGLVRFFGWFSMAFFGLCVVVTLRRLLTQRGPVVTMAPQGIRDTRIAPEFIPWSAIHGISTWEFRRQKIMVLAVDPAVERSLTLTRTARWSRGANRALGADGLCVAATGLKTSYDALLQATRTYAAHARDQIRTAGRHGASPPFR